MVDHHIFFSLSPHMFWSNACDSLCLLSATFHEKTETAVSAEQSEPTGIPGSTVRPADPTVIAPTNMP